jgi:LacI family transcriptional regulator, repressor for deo operon, udp, cdd, tsx, nupC, and nupG
MKSGDSTPKTQTSIPVGQESSGIPNLPKAPTIKQFAQAIGVSPTTVSRSITRRGRVSDETRQMVLERMKELGYTPNLHAQRLVTGRANTVALCMGPTSDPFLMGLIPGLQQALQEYDYGLLIVGTGDLLKRWVDSRAVDGVVVVGGHVDGVQAGVEVARSVARPSVPCIVIENLPLNPEPHIGSVIIDLPGSGVQVARALVEKGHRRIGFIGSPYSQSLLPAFQSELKRLGAPMLKKWALMAGTTSDDGENAMTYLLSLPTSPTAVFARNDELAVGALRAARKRRVRVPEELSIIGHDDLAFARLTEPPLSTVRIDSDAIGKAVVTLLFDLLDQPGTLFPARSVATELVARATVQAPSGSD